MQSVSADLAAAITTTTERPQALVRLRVDWNRNGTFTDTYQGTFGGGAATTTTKALGLNPDATTTQINSDLDHLASVGVTTCWLVLAMEWGFPSSTTIDASVGTKWDAVVNGAQARGMEVALQIHGNPNWNIVAGGHSGTLWHGPDNATERANYVTMVHNAINRWGASKIEWAEIWNEPNLVEFWAQGPSADQYSRLLQACYVDIKATWPSIKVVGHNMSRNDFGWLTACYAATDTAFGAGTAAANDYYFDVLGVHPYCGNSTSGFSPADESHSDEGGFGGGGLDPDYLGYRRLHSQVVTKEGSAKRLAFGEFGYPTMGAGWFKVTEANRATYIDAAIELAAGDGFVDYLNVYYHRLDTPVDYGTSFNIHGSTTETAFTNAQASIGGGGTSVTLPLDDLSADVVSVDLNRDLTTDLPPQAKLFSGAAAAEATIVLAHRDPAGDPAKHAAWFYSPLNAASPLFSYKRKGAPAILEFGFVTANGPEYVTVLTGSVRSIQVTSGGRQAVMRIADRSETMRRQVTLPMVIADGDVAGAAVVRPGLNTTFLADWVARRCGWYASPPQRTGCKFMATMHGSGYPEVGTIEEHHGDWGSKLAYSPTPTFPTAAKWVQAVDTSGSNGQALRYFLGGAGVISTNNAKTCLIQGWARFSNTAVDQPLAIIFNTSATADPYFCLWWQTSTGQLKLNFNRGGADVTDRTSVGPTVSPGTSAWHYYAVLVSFDSTGVDVTFRYDGTSTVATKVTTPSVTGAPACQRIQIGRGRVSSFVDDHFDGLTEDWQATTESSVSSWDNSFVPTAEIHASASIDNRLVATPAAVEEGWPLFQEIAASEFATAGFTEAGKLFYWPRDRWTTAPYTTSQRTLSSTTALKELETVEAIDQVRNRVVLRSKVPEVLDQSTVWKLGSRSKIPASGSKTIWISLDDPVGNVDGSVVYGTALGSSRFLASDVLDGQGAQVTNLVFDVLVMSPTSIKVIVTNPNAFVVYLAGDENASATYSGKPYFWLDAQLVKFGQEATSSNERAEATNGTSIANYGEQLLELEDSDFRQDSDDIQQIADDLAAALADPGPALSDVPVVGDPRLQLGDRVTIVDPDGLAANADFHLSSCDLTFDEGGLSGVISLRSA